MFTDTPHLGNPVAVVPDPGLARWRISAGVLPARYVASQGTALGREGRVHVEQVGAEIWIGGDTVTCLIGAVRLWARGRAITAPGQGSPAASSRRWRTRTIRLLRAVSIDVVRPGDRLGVPAARRE